MRFFNWRKNKKVPCTPSETAPPALTASSAVCDAMEEISKLITGDDLVAVEASRCALDIAGYYSAHEEWYEERGLGPDDPQLCWFGLVEILERRHYACERDWKEEKEDFLFFFGRLKGIQRFALPIDPDWFSAEGDIAEWCAVLRDKWAEKRCFAAAFAIDSDSYVLFPCHADDFARLEELAPLVGGAFHRMPCQ